MKIRYTVEFDDVKAFWQHFLSTSAVLRRQRVVFVACFAGVFLLVGIRLGLRDASIVPVVWFAFLGTVFLSLFWRFSRRVSAKRLRRLCPPEENKGVLCEHTLELTDAGVTETSLVGQHSTTWAGILRVVETTSHVFVYIGSNMAHVIPRAKVLDGDMDAFINKLKAELESQRPVP